MQNIPLAKDTAVWDVPYGMFGVDRTLSEDKGFDVYFGCGVGRGHSGQYKMAHRECLLVEDRCPIGSGRS